MEERGKLCKPNASTKSSVLHLTANYCRNEKEYAFGCYGIEILPILVFEINTFSFAFLYEAMAIYNRNHLWLL